MLRRCSRCLGLTQRLAALGWVLRVFLSRTLTCHGKCSKRTKTAATLEALCTFIAGATPQSIPVN